MKHTSWVLQFLFLMVVFIIFSFLLCGVITILMAAVTFRPTYELENITISDTAIINHLIVNTWSGPSGPNSAVYTGPTGPQGIQGNSITGPTGPQGAQGYTSGKLYYLNSSVTGSIGSPYAQLGSSAVIGSTRYSSTITLPAAGNSGTIKEFITDVGDPNVLFIPPGIWNATCFMSANVSGGGAPLTDVQCYVEYFKYTSTGSLQFLQQSSIQPITTTSASPYQFSAQFNYTALELSDRIICRIQGSNTTSPSRSVTITSYFQDNTYSNIISSLSVIQVGPTGPTGAGISITNGASTRILTSTSSSTANAETNLTFNGSNLRVVGDITLGSPSYTGTIHMNATGCTFSTNLIANEPTLTLGTLAHPWKSIYVSTGTVFIGPTGTLEINNNGVISSQGGIATPFIQIGSTNPGQGITLNTFDSKLYFISSSGASGPVSVFNQASNNSNNAFFTGGNLGIGVSAPMYPMDIAGDLRVSNGVVFDSLGS